MWIQTVKYTNNRTDLLSQTWKKTVIKKSAHVIIIILLIYYHYYSTALNIRLSILKQLKKTE